MKKLLFPLLVALGLLFAGCGGDDNGTDGNGNGVAGPIRVVVDTTVTKPTFSDVNEAVWSNVTGKNIEIGGSTTYGVNPNLGKQNVMFKAIKKSDTLFLWVSWHDATASIWGGYLEKSSYQTDWSEETYSGEDKFLIVFADSGNGSEWADCASMCHATEHHTTGGGDVDAWKWLATKTAPAFLAEDDFWNGSTSSNDANIFDHAYKRNWWLSNHKPIWIHKDSLEYNGPFLYAEDADTMDTDAYFLDWPTGHKLPGYKLDSTVHSLPTSESRWDVRAISEFDSSGTSASEYTWTVVFKRALNTGHNNDDINMADLDSVQVTLAATHNDYEFPAPITPIAHSGSKPFWLILKP